MLVWFHGHILVKSITINFKRMCPMKHKNNGKRYNDDFRKMVVELYNSGQSVKSLSSSLLRRL